MALIRIFVIRKENRKPDDFQAPPLAGFGARSRLESLPPLEEFVHAYAITLNLERISSFPAPAT